MLFRSKKRYQNSEIEPDQILLDASNVSDMELSRFEGRLEQPIRQGTLYMLFIFCSIIFSIFLWKLWALQVIEGEGYAKQSIENRLNYGLLFANRGSIYDRNEVPLAWNKPREGDEEFSKRLYTDTSGFAHLLGFLTYPQKDSSGFYYQKEHEGQSGLEKYASSTITGTNGVRIEETNALGEVISKSSIRHPEHGQKLVTSIDARLQEKLYESIKNIANQVNFEGGAGAIMNVETGEMLVMVSYPEFDVQVMTDGDDAEHIESLLNDKRHLFLNRLTQGLYTPGSIVKPFVAAAALEEKVVTPETVIVSTSKMYVPNPYDPSKPSVFSDWKAHGPVDVRKALAMSSNIYFYQIGGGFETQKGIGIAKINEYLEQFGFGKSLQGGVFGALDGVVPNPSWKEETFDGDQWRLGDTYFTAIGQYGFQVTPLQALRGIATLANGGTLRNPTFIKGDVGEVIGEVAIDTKHLDTVRNGMRDAVTGGTAQGLWIPEIDVAAKTGTAEIGVSKAKVNSWITGFWPHEKPKYAFIVVMERGDRKNLIGGVAVMRQFFDWMRFEDGMEDYL